ncbi:hypothetical protein CVV65_05700 [Kyrpidia spormannii]|uniref:Nucleic acid-binding protein n=1 Tax=Kyrpidia spormannii TaxID=2055160 RepID=A0A2K8N568_9BACL|nr:hypothetical protein CVV65_05700 [Kyrpidia spormannii]
MPVTSDDLYGTSAIVDNSVLNELASLGSVRLLNGVFSRVYMAENMIRVEARFPGANKALAELAPVRIAAETEEEIGFWAEIMRKRKALSRNDAEMIAIAAQRSLVCCTSDGPMIKTCEMYGIRRTGTLGVLALSYRRGHITPKEFCVLVDKLFSLPDARYSESVKREFLAGFPEVFGEK